MSKPITVQERDQSWELEGGWDDWTPDELPDLTDVPMWPEASWNRSVVDAPVDLARANALATHPHAQCWIKAHTGMGEGRFSGVPYQRVDDVTRRTKVWERRKGFLDMLFNPAKVPLPDVVARVGDPAGGGDQQWIGVSTREMFELGSCTPQPFDLPHPWACGRVHKWSLSKPWDRQKVKGSTAGAIPLLPLLARPEEFAAGRIMHAQHLVVPNYAPSAEGIVPPANGSDGTWKGHPLRAGERLVLTDAAHARLVGKASTRDDVTFLAALRVYGCIVDDKTGNDGQNGRALQGNIRTAMDPRIHLSVTDLRLGDFVPVIAL